MAHDYARFGAGFAATAALFKTGLNLLGSASRLAEKVEPGKLNNWEKAGIAFNIAKFAGTVPLLAPDQPASAYGLKVAAYGVAFLQALSQPIIRYTMPSETGDVVDGSVMCGANAIVMSLLTVADGLGNADPLTWSCDILSNAGGSLLGVRGATKNSKNPYVEILSGTAFAFGLLGSIAGITSTFAHAITVDEEELLQVVNPGG